MLDAMRGITTKDHQGVTGNGNENSAEKKNANEDGKNTKNDGDDGEKKRGLRVMVKKRTI